MDKLLNTKLFLLDMDGTLYLGDEVFDGAVDFIDTVKKSGREYIYLTNNSSRAGVDYITRLRKLGFPCEKENVFTSGMATAMYLNSRHKGELVYPVGTPAFLGELESSGVPLGDSEEVGVVCVGFDTTLTYEKLDKAVHYLRRGAAFVAANPDWVCPTDEETILVDCGSLQKCIEGATKRKADVVIGKTNPNMLYCIRDKYGLKSDEIAMVGDRIYTDVATAQNAGSLGVLVLSGETTLETALANDPNPDLTALNIEVFGQLLEKSRKI